MALNIKKDNAGRNTCSVAEIGQFASLPEDILNGLQSICRYRSFRQDQVISEAGEHIGFVGVVEKGILRMQKTDVEGRQHIVGLLVEGDMFGRVFNRPMQFSLEAATDASVMAFSRPAFETLLSESRELDRVVMLNILNELDRARDWMLILSNAKVKTRLAGFLMMLCTRFADVDHILRTSGGKLVVSVPVSRADLASLLGTRPESISRAFHAMNDDGCIVLKQPDLIEIADLEALADEAGEDFFDMNLSLSALVQIVRKKAI